VWPRFAALEVQLKRPLDLDVIPAQAGLRRQDAEANTEAGPKVEGGALLRDAK
jgi:hypothetical protein